ncbi:MAG: hypothetical protein M1485_07570 [Chloroflexi bacterium]|nr:hypothetical protein [Chloroflexota bacterium]
MTEQNVEITAEPADKNISTNKRIRQISWMVIAIVVTFLLGLGSGYLKWGQDETAAAKQQRELARLYEQINPKDGYALPVTYGNLGPQLIGAGAINYDAFQNVMKANGNSIDSSQIDILKKGSDQQVVITAENAHFLLNFFWAVGLANRNSILTEGPMTQYGNGQIEGFASTGGWTLATKSITELYASMDLISLTPEQQARVEEVAAAVYRPCCNNYTLFPDCNHGMAMLGLLELMASQNASVDEMFNSAKYVNAYWFPQQTLETAIYLKTNQGTDFAKADARLVVSKDYSSASGASMVHQSLQSSGQLKQTPNQGGSCAN